MSLKSFFDELDKENEDKDSEEQEKTVSNKPVKHKHKESDDIEGFKEWLEAVQRDQENMDSGCN